ncbi:MAG: DUF4293 domain-containing protein [Paludibacteraceae bacterium]|nr:DUF4293 domain-containing protein [Paludibacteraceae bacterium]
MIQRIQTIYLLIVTILGILLCCFPMASCGDFTLKMGCTIPYSVLIVLMPCVSFASIFLYKKRVLQMRFNSFNIIIMVLTALLCAFYLYIQRKATGAEISLLLPTVILPINIILSYLAIRAIGKDEVLVRSLDRLR